MAAMQRTFLPLRCSSVSKALFAPWTSARTLQGQAGSRRRGQAIRADPAPGSTAQLPVPEVYSETTDPELKAFQDHQATAARPSAAEAGKTLMHSAKFGMLATVDMSVDAQGLPLGSVVEYAADARGCPVFAVSAMSAHTAGLEKDQRVSLTVMSQGFKGLSDARFTLQGRVRRVKDEEKGPLREAFLKKYPDAFWVDFGDFKWFIMDDITIGRYNGGFAMARKVSGADYLSAARDPVAQFSGPVCKHMNDDHEEDMKAMIKHYVGLQVDSPRMLDIDRLGINFDVKFKGQGFKLRLPYPRPVEDRKGIKDAVVEMTKAAKAAASAPAN